MESSRFARPTQPTNGFTLVELVIVVAIVGIVAAIAAPRYAQSIDRYRVRMASDRISADLRLARERAKITGIPQTITFDLVTDSYQNTAMIDLDNPTKTYEVQLDSDPFTVKLMDVDFGGATSVTFDMYGQPTSGGHVSIAKGDRTLYIMLDTGTGRSKATSEEPQEVPGEPIFIKETLPPATVF